MNDWARFTTRSSLSSDTTVWHKFTSSNIQQFLSLYQFLNLSIRQQLLNHAKSMNILTISITVKLTMSASLISSLVMQPVVSLITRQYWIPQNSPETHKFWGLAQFCSPQPTEFCPGICISSSRHYSYRLRMPHVYNWN